jgi:ribonuclease T2
MVRSALRSAAALAFLVALGASAAPQDRSGGLAPHDGRFDFYVLSLSWSPSFCAAAAERRAARAATPECGLRPYSFVVHGLWPQYERGFPQYCQVPPPRLYHGLVSSMLDLMPAPRLVFNEWDRHGTCSGMSARAYFEEIRHARARVNIPPEYVDVQRPLTVSPKLVADAFIKANPALAEGDMAVECDKKRLTEIRFCLSKDLNFRACPQVAKRSCRRDEILMPPSRGARTGAGPVR